VIRGSIMVAKGVVEIKRHNTLLSTHTFLIFVLL
jgi:hypothetical protein